MISIISPTRRQEEEELLQVGKEQGELPFFVYSSDTMSLVSGSMEENGEWAVKAGTSG